MADPELIRVMDYILNRCDEGAIEAVAAAVVRRRRDLALFGGARNLPDPRKLAKDVFSQVNIGATLEGVKGMVRSMAERIIKQEAPELTGEQIAGLLAAWLPGDKPPGQSGETLPVKVLASMADQFTAFSLGRMSQEEDAALRKEMGEWPERYWNAFPPVIRLVIRDFLKGETDEREFQSRLLTALSLRGPEHPEESA